MTGDLSTRDSQHPARTTGKRRQRVLLIYPIQIKPDSFFGFVLPPLGLERIAAHLESFVDVKIMDLRFEGENWIESATAFAPDFIGVSVKSTMYAHRSYFIADRLRAAFPQTRIVLGGLHASSIPEEAARHCDFVVIGEGEETFAELVHNGKPREEIAGLCFIDAGGLPVCTPPRPLRENMDDLLPPARHLRRTHYQYAAAGMIPMDLLETSRGCDRYCPFCSPAVLHRGRWRAHSPEYVVGEVKRIAALGAKYVMLTDDNFSGDLDRAKRISELIIATGIRIAYFCFLRPFVGRMDVKRAMVEAGFVMLSYGAESPNPEQLKRYGKGFTDPKNFIATVNREWHDAGARYIGNSFVFGDPFESAADLERLGDYARDLDPTYIEPLYSQPFPGTRYREELARRGLLNDRSWDDFTEGRLLIKHPEIDEAGLLAKRVRMWLRFFSPRKIAGAFRVPLYLHEVVGIPVRIVLRYMKVCDYSMFGCILEDKFYLHHKRAMLREYLTDHINGFTDTERDMTPFVDAFTDMIGLGRIKRALGKRSIAVEIVDGGHIVTRFLAEFDNGCLGRLRVGLDLPSADHSVRIRLDDVIDFISGRDILKIAALARTGGLLLAQLASRALAWVFLR
ncbi:MAG: cobalamin-dependent protein [Candidatus Riflebacteria bacterium]|nr:cobalamin-dependent protein [Candidatus Riflebacteria bacterium]